MENLDNAIAYLDEHVGDPTEGIGEEVFHLVSRFTPIVNVDLLIKNPAGEILLTWRDDQFYGPGWHIPGGVIRFKETFAERIAQVAQDELGTQVSCDYQPISVQEVMNHTRNTRGHFISILFNCDLAGLLNPEMAFSENQPANNQWKWHNSCPDNLIAVHKRIYSHLF